jgi:hypothetical protein
MSLVSTAAAKPLASWRSRGKLGGGACSRPAGRRASSVARARCRAPLTEASLLPSAVRQSPFATFIDYRVQRPA